jgi:hypothetical protein
MSMANRRSKLIWGLFFGFGALALIALLPIHPRSKLTENQMRVVEMLRQVQPSIEGCCIASVSVGNRLSLVPNRAETFSGYVFKLQVTGKDYQITAMPEHLEVTGLRSFRVDSEGRVYTDGFDVPIAHGKK